MTEARIYDDRTCALGEGPLWHPERQQFFWFDILGKRLLSRVGDTPLVWDWEEHVSAAGWVDRNTLMVASETALWTFDIDSGDRTPVAPLEADNKITRSNDGRADPMGGFWIGTMGLNAEPEAGGIYRYYRGEVRQIFFNLTIPNAICFSPGGETAYFADTAQGIVWRQRLDRAGWPSGKREVFADFSGVGLNPDGAVCDENGDVWIAQWGAWRVARHGPDGSFKDAVSCGAAHTSCPAFGGAELDQMLVTSARQHLPEDNPEHHRRGGQTWIAQMPVRGIPERKVIL